jgi:lipoprotein-anchoring transpeptidase ErfK/SrfK
VAHLFALSAILTQLAAPTGQATPKSHAVRPTDGDSGTLVASVKPGGRVSLRARPNGRSVGVLGARTVYGSPLAMPVVRRRGSWLGVVSAAMPNGRLGWVAATSGSLAFGRVKLEIEVDLSRRLLRVWAAGRVVRRMHVGVGRAGTSTPTGRFSLTDKLRGADYGSYYGCCILALSGHQTHTPRGWTGGARLAIHGGSTAGTVSAGCLHASTRDLRYLMRMAPLGTQVHIHA